ncbi:MAG: hypothetical protein IJ093_02325 [Bacilli bacterium]|nr:hypothetical protein [Bacilli bacterium]
MYKKCTMLINPKSSKYNAKVIENCKSIIQDKGYNLDVVFPDETNFLQSFYQKASKANENSDLVMTYGGDGFFGLYQNILHQEGQNAIISHIPMGTANDMALNLGITPKTIEATKDTLEGTVEERDIVTSNDIAFGYVSTFGHITNIPYDTPANLKKIGPAGYLVAALPDILKLINGKYKTYQITITTPTKKQKMECLLGAVSNAKGFGGVELYPSASQNDGKFEVLLVKPQIIKKVPKLIKDFSYALIKSKRTPLNIFENYQDEIEFFQTDFLQIDFEQSPEKPFDNDGDKGPLLKQGEPITYQTKQKCKLLLPKRITKQ